MGMIPSTFHATTPFSPVISIAANLTLQIALPLATILHLCLSLCNTAVILSCPMCEKPRLRALCLAILPRSRPTMQRSVRVDPDNFDLLSSPGLL